MLKTNGKYIPKNSLRIIIMDIIFFSLTTPRVSAKLQSCKRIFGPPSLIAGRFPAASSSVGIGTQYQVYYNIIYTYRELSTGILVICEELLFARHVEKFTSNIRIVYRATVTTDRNLTERCRWCTIADSITSYISLCNDHEPKDVMNIYIGTVYSQKIIRGHIKYRVL